EHECGQKCRAPLTTTPERVRARPCSTLPATPECACAHIPSLTSGPHRSPLKAAVNRPQRRGPARGVPHPFAVAAAKFTPPGDQRPLGSLLPVLRFPMPLAAEIAVARVAGKLSRLAGAGGGTTVPGKLLWKLDPGAIDRLAARLPEGSAVISATNGKTTTAAMAAGILRNRLRLAHNSSGANLVSGVASTLLDASDAELGLFEVDEGALPEIVARVRPKAVCLGNLFRDQLDRYGELEHVAARWREAVRGLPAETALVVNGDDPQLGALARVRSGAPLAPACRRFEVLRAVWDAVRVRGCLHGAPRRVRVPRLRRQASPT